ncbi:class A beta-lactamase-related serine hydrolase [Maribacter algicola]|uniref:Class A beta-lactamase-related serine hydrolase n=1 Tax=Maribacter algicola TaxID=2498892 RepID=A0A3R8PZK7_9FLAO|nr:serine hydrolase domain-containing protein [Maribacter algicola]RRQ49918.1 class A beta-lactamase-related serine hydrolase [Maribacter algicola]
MKNVLFYASLSCFMILGGCKHQTHEQVTPSPTEKAQRFSNNYIPPKFENDQRTSKITGAQDKIQRIFEANAKARHIPGISYGIVVDDSLVLTGSYGVIDLETQIEANTTKAFRIASMTKSFTAMAILKLRDEGKLDLDDPVSNYFPQLDTLVYLTQDSPAITIKNLLTMTAGFPEDNPWGDRHLNDATEMLENMLAEGLSLSKVPSFQFEYSNTGYGMLGQIVAKVSGITYQEYITQNILRPLAMEHTYWEYEKVPKDMLVHGYRYEDDTWKPEPILHDGVFGSMGGLITTIADFSKYVSFHLSAWPPRSEKDNGPVKRSTLREMHTPQYPYLSTWATDWNNEPCARVSGYGYGLGISEDCKGIIKVSHGGALPGYGSNYSFFPEYGIGIMAFGNLTYTGPLPLDEISKVLFEELELQPRKKVASQMLKKKKDQLVSALKTWETGMDTTLFADNFFLDRSLEKRTQHISDLKQTIGEIDSIGEIRPRNQLRGDFEIYGKHGAISVFFTLNPEIDPKIQQLEMRINP